MIKRLSVILILGAVTLFVTPKTNSKHVSGLALQADGGLPIPPWPGPSNAIQPVVRDQARSSLLADGGLPIPPWPGPSNAVKPSVLAQTPSLLLADGGLPIPPWPPSGGVAV